MKLTKYECDACGNVHGYRNEMAHIPVRYESDEWMPNEDEKLHLCTDHDSFAAVVGAVKNCDVGWWCVNGDGTVVGYISLHTEAFVDIEERSEGGMVREAAAVVEKVV